MDKEMIDFTRNALLGNVSGQPLCASYKAALRQCGDDKEMLIRLAMQQQSTPYLSHACYKKLGITKEYIMENYAEYINGNRTFEDVEGVSGYTYKMYVGYDKDFVVTADVTSMMWCNGSQIVIKPTKCPTIYVSNKSKVRLVCDGYNTVNVKLFDESELIIEDMDASSEVVVYKYSDKAKVEEGKFCLKEPKVFNKKLRL